MGEFVLKRQDKPANYKPPKEFSEVENVLRKLKMDRQPVIDRIWLNKRAIRGEWSDVVKMIPTSYRQMLLPPDLPQLRDMVNRISGHIRRQEPNIEVTPPSARDPDVRQAANEEKRFRAVRIQIADQQDRDPWEMGIDAQCRWGESWVTVWPDPKRLQWDGYKRKPEEDAKSYLGRRREGMLNAGIPLCVTDHDPQTVFPFRTNNERLGLVLIESQHTVIDVEMGIGYKKVGEGDTSSWQYTGGTLSQPYVHETNRSGAMNSDVDHDNAHLNSSAGPTTDKMVRKVIWLDPWTYQCWLDGVLVEEWEHDWGIVPAFPADGGNTADRDPGWGNYSLVDPALQIGKQIVWFSAVLSSNAALHGFPTPFLENPQHGITVRGNEPIVRKVAMGQMNLLAQGEKITFPYMEANMLPDFFRHMDWLTSVLDGTILSSMDKALSGDVSGYLMAQVRAMETAVLNPVYTGAARQLRKVMYFIRWLVANAHVPPLVLPGAVESDDDGRQFRPILDFGPEHCTQFAINIHVEEGIKQDEIAERKSAIEMGQAGYWSRRRVQEKTGVEDPALENDEIDSDRVLQSPAADQVVLQMAMRIAMQRDEATRQDMSSPFYQALQEAQGAVMGDGQFRNQGGIPENANAAGPIQNQPQMRTQQPGGPAQGPTEGVQLDQLGVPKLPGGVKGVQQTPAV